MKHGVNAALIAISLLAATVATATTEYRYDSGSCDDKAIGEWYSVTTFEDGNPVAVQGRGCDGVFYYRNLCDTGERALESDTISVLSRARTEDCGTGGDIR